MASSDPAEQTADGVGRRVDNNRLQARRHSRRPMWRRYAAVIIGLTMAVSQNLLAQTPEFRAMWAFRYEWPDVDEATCKANLDNIMQDLQANNFNAVFLQIRGQCDVLYPSPYEVWSPIIGGTDPGWDPVAYAVDVAHANGLEFHAYINTHTCWLDPGGQALPANPDHLFYAHCNAADPDHHDWLICGSSGTPVQWSGNYVWIAPGIPDFQAYVRQQVMYVVHNYDIDGVHFDRIRTAGSGYSYDPISLARLASLQSNPDSLDFHAWTADQTTRLVRDIYAEMMAVKPHIKVSAAVIESTAADPLNCHQDSLAWIQTGGMDMLVPMMYYGGGEGSQWDTTLQTWLSGSAGRHIIAGQSCSVDIKDLLDQIVLSRTRGTHGNSVFSYTSFTTWDDYRNNVYQTAVTTPAMPWKDSPTTGIIYGYVTDAGSSPVVDVQVTRSSSSYTGLSSADGLYSFLLVPPGTYTLTASHIGYDPVSVPDVTVSAGAVTRQDIALGALYPPVIAEVTPDPDEAIWDRPYTRQLALNQGTAEAWTLMQGPEGASLNSLTGALRWTPLWEDVGQSIPLTVRASNAAGSDDETWNVQVPVPFCATFKLADFEAYTSGTRVLFQRPGYSSQSHIHLASTPNVGEVTEAVPAFNGDKCYVFQWQYLDTAPERWARVTTSNTANIPNPIIELDRPIRIRLRLDSGYLRLALGIREATTTGDLGTDGGTIGPIEFLGAAATVDSAPQGVLVEPMPGVWQTFIFDPSTDPVVTFTGDGILHTANYKGTLECLAFSVVDSVGPFTVYIDDVELLCAHPPSGDFDGDGDVDQEDFGHLQSCLTGPAVPQEDFDCQDARLDVDSDVDQQDVSIFQGCMSGADVMADPRCGD